MRILAPAILTAASAVILSSMLGSTSCSSADNTAGRENDDQQGEKGGSAGKSTVSDQKTGGSNKSGSGGNGNAANGGAQAGEEGGEGTGDARGGGVGEKGGAKATGGGGEAQGKGGKANAGGSNDKGAGGAAPTNKGGAQNAGGSTVGGKDSGTGATGGTSTGTGGGGGGGKPASFKCDIPAAGQGGKPKPSGTAKTVKVLDWAGFSSAISYTFDDSNSSQINNYSQMKAAGGRYTFFLITSKSDSNNAVWKTAVADGMEVAAHCNSHTHSGSASDAQTANKFIKDHLGVDVYSFAAPYGDTSWKSAVASLYLLDRSVAGGTVSPNDNSDPSWLPAVIPAQDADSSKMGPSAGKWQIYCIHGFNGGSDSAYHPVDVTKWASAVKSAISDGVWVDTMTNVGSYWLGQKQFKSGTGKITWTLPANFPPGKCLRVTTEGGTLSQNGEELPWDEHGYYEISLDAKSLDIQ